MKLAKYLLLPSPLTILSECEGLGPSAIIQALLLDLTVSLFPSGEILSFQERKYPKKLLFTPPFGLSRLKFGVARGKPKDGRFFITLVFHPVFSIGRHGICYSLATAELPDEVILDRPRTGRSSAAYRREGT